jgi:hypothetical protein
MRLQTQGHKGKSYAASSINSETGLRLSKEEAKKKKMK